LGAHQNGCINKENPILHSKGLRRSIGDMGEKIGTLFYVFNKVLAFQVKLCHSGCLSIPFWFIFE
jgi:hypothetical protein